MSPRQEPGLTFEQKVQRKAATIRNMAQYRQRRDRGEFTDQEYEDFVMERARLAVIAHERRKLDAASPIVTTQQQRMGGAKPEADEAFREQRLAVYSKQYGDWDDAGDRALLMSLIELETQQRIIIRSMQSARTITDKEKYWKALRENSDAQAKLQVSLGIDKKTRDQAKHVENPMDNWEEIKSEVAEFYDKLVSEFPEEADAAQNESILRDLMRYKLSWPFALVDAIIRNIKRVNGLESTVVTEPDQEKE